MLAVAGRGQRHELLRRVGHFSTSAGPSPRADQEGGVKKKTIWRIGEVKAAATEKRLQEQAVDQAKWVSSWMTPWERAQMDEPGGRPLRLWERVYWRLCIVLGGFGFAYETWVLGNRRVWNDHTTVINSTTCSNYPSVSVIPYHQQSQPQPSDTN